MFSKLIHSIDRLGGNYNLKLHGEERFRTYLGGFLTLLSVLTFVIFFFIIGVDFYLRINPQVTTSKTLSNEYFNYTLNRTNFLYAFRIESNGQLLLRPDLFYIEPHYIVYNQTEEGMIKLVDEIVPFHVCNYEDANYNEVYNTSVMSQFMCLDNPKNSEGYVGGGLYDAKYIKYFKIKISHCSAGAKYNKLNNVTCEKNMTNFRNLFTNTALYVKYIIQSFYMDSNNYDDPFKLSFDSMYQTMELNSQKKIYFYFKKGVLNDNKGWIVNKSYLKEYIGLDRQRLDYRDGSADFSQNVFYEINLYFDRIIENYNRKYEKIQDVLAGVGGLIKIITFVFGNLVVYYNHFYRNVNVINKVLLKTLINIKYPLKNSKTDIFNNRISNINQNNSFLEMNKQSNNNIINNNNSNFMISHGNEVKESPLNNEITVVNQDSKFKKIKTFSVFRKNDERNMNQQGIHVKKLNSINENKFRETLKIDFVKISFYSYILNYFCRKFKNLNSNYGNYLKFCNKVDNNLDISNILEFFIRNEHIIEQTVVSSDQIFLNNGNLNN